MPTATFQYGGSSGPERQLSSKPLDSTPLTTVEEQDDVTAQDLAVTEMPDAIIRRAANIHPLKTTNET